MKRYHHLIVSALILSLMIISSCHDEDPCPTCFDSFVTCKVDGKEWRSNCISNDPLFGCRAVNTYYYLYDGLSLNLSGVNDKARSGITINYSGRFGGIEIGNNKIYNRDVGFSNYLLKGNCIRLDSIDLNFNNILIIESIDTINYILEGKFGFRVFNLCGDTATITDGYFKTKFIF